MALSLRQINYFIATAEAGKLSLAASQLGVSQSARERSAQNLSNSERSRRSAPTGSWATRIPYSKPPNWLGLVAGIEVADIGERDELL